METFLLCLASGVKNAYGFKKNDHIIDPTSTEDLEN
jgi:hypothetical protein